VAVAYPFAESELRLLRALLKHKVRFMRVGLSAARLAGLLPAGSPNRYLRGWPL
jgi:hypothetical protein